MGRTDRDMVLSVRKHTYSPRGGGFTTTGVLPEEWRVWAPHRAPQPKDPALKDKPPESWVWKTAELILESQRYTGYRGFSFTEWTQNLTYCQYQQETVVWKFGSDLLGDLGEPPWEAGGNWEAPWGLTVWQQPLKGSWYPSQTIQKIFHRKEHLQIISMRTASP